MLFWLLAKRWQAPPPPPREHQASAEVAARHGCPGRTLGPAALPVTAWSCLAQSSTTPGASAWRCSPDPGVPHVLPPQVSARPQAPEQQVARAGCRPANGAQGPARLTKGTPCPPPLFTPTQAALVRAAPKLSLSAARGGGAHRSGPGSQEGGPGPGGSRSCFPRTLSIQDLALTD